MLLRMLCRDYKWSYEGISWTNLWIIDYTIYSWHNSHSAPWPLKQVLHNILETRASNNEKIIAGSIHYSWIPLSHYRKFLEGISFNGSSWISKSLPYISNWFILLCFWWYTTPSNMNYRRSNSSCWLLWTLAQSCLRSRTNIRRNIGTITIASTGVCTSGYAKEGKEHRKKTKYHPPGPRFNQTQTGIHLGVHQPASMIHLHCLPSCHYPIVWLCSLSDTLPLSPPIYLL